MTPAVSHSYAPEVKVHVFITTCCICSSRYCGMLCTCLPTAMGVITSYCTCLLGIPHSVLIMLLCIHPHYFYSEPEVFYVPVLRAVDNVMPPHLGSPCTMQELELESPIRDETGTPVMGHALAGPMPSSKVSWPCTGWTYVVL